MLSQPHDFDRTALPLTELELGKTGIQHAEASGYVE
jgi:hypothetical protein